MKFLRKVEKQFLNLIEKLLTNQGIILCKKNIFLIWLNVIFMIIEKLPFLNCDHFFKLSFLSCDDFF